MDIKVHRKKEITGRAGKIDLYVNGEHLAKMKSDEVFSFEANEPVTLQARAGKICSNPLVINPGESTVCAELSYKHPQGGLAISGGIFMIMGTVINSLSPLAIGLGLMIASFVFQIKQSYVLEVLSDREL